MKKGAVGHIEIVLSFIIFVAFVSFTLFYIQPYKQNTISDSIATGLRDNFESVASASLTTLLLKANVSGCGAIPIDIYGNSVAKDLSGNSIQSYLSSGRLNIASTGIFKVYISQDITSEGTLSCPQLESGNYTIGSINQETALSYQKIQTLRENYYSDYSSLKKQFKIPDSYDFSIVSDANLSLNRTAYEEANVFAVSQAYNILYPNGDLKTKEFIFKIW